jgi:uncharacterized protein (TIGR00661 family)
MRILYGIQCTGNGHITRSIKVINRLKLLGHQVDILLSGKNSELNFPFEVKYRFKGFTLYTDATGGIDYTKTILSFDIISFIKHIRLSLNDYDKVITDFEPITAWACKLHNKPCYGISNQYSFVSKKTPRADKDFFGEKILKWMAPVETPIGLHYKQYDNFIYKPIINDEIINTKPLDAGHYTVYLPSYSLINTIEELTSFNNIFHIFHTDIKTVYRFKNCIIYPIDKKSFVDSFRNSHGIITNAGFQTSSEALYMSKKLMVIPVKGQYEQECNAEALKNIGVVTGKLEDIELFLQTDKIKFDKWDDPTNQILDIILSS